MNQEKHGLCNGKGRGSELSVGGKGRVSQSRGDLGELLKGQQNKYYGSKKVAVRGELGL